ncbi:ATP-dependent sacrificial sulfur transferase LarE [Bacteroidota bacterium]
MKGLYMDDLLKRLEDWFKQKDKVIVAFSGGVDSCLVIFLARQFLGKENAVAIISKSASLKSRDLKIARKFCDLYDIRLEEITTKEMEDPDYLRNPINRCFFCKTNLYSELEGMIATQYPDYTILNGNNFSDNGDYRPGMEAARNYNAYSPLAECKIEKSDVRTLAKHFNLFTWDKPASPCLSSRFPYGESITFEKLRMVEEAEDILNEYGFNDVRVRYMEKSAKIEVPDHLLEDLKKIFNDVELKILNLGFEKCYIDEEGLVSGKLNRGIDHVKQN